MVQPKAQRKDDAHQKTGTKREVEAGTAAVIDNVSRQMPEMKPARVEDQPADNHNHAPQHDQKFSDFNHKFIVARRPDKTEFLPRICADGRGQKPSTTEGTEEHRGFFFFISSVILCAPLWLRAQSALIRGKFLLPILIA